MGGGGQGKLRQCMCVRERERVWGCGVGERERRERERRRRRRRRRRSRNRSRSRRKRKRWHKMQAYAFLPHSHPFFLCPVHRQRRQGMERAMEREEPGMASRATGRKGQRLNLIPAHQLKHDLRASAFACTLRFQDMSPSWESTAPVPLRVCCFS